jgi:protein TonB
MEHPDRQAAATRDEFGSGARTLTADHSSSGTRPAPRIVALSDDPVLLEAIGAAALDFVQVIVSPSTDRFIDQVVALGGGLALIDAAAVPENLPEFLESVHRQFPQLQLLLAGPGTIQHQLGTQMTDGTVFRFVHKPASAQRLKLLLDAALRERQTRITQEILRLPLPDLPAAAPAPGGSGRRGWLVATAVLAALIAVAGAVQWYASQGPRPADRSVPSQAPAAAAVVESPPPAPASSKQTETEQEAIDRAAAERSERAEKERLAAEAEARQAAQAAQIRRADDEAREAEIHQMVQKARSRIASGALIEPADDSARTYVSAAWDQAPDDQEVRAVSVALGDAMINSFREALAGGDTASAERWLKACRSYQIAPPTLQQMAVQLESYRAAQVAQTAAAQAVENSPAVETGAADMTASPATVPPVPAAVTVATPTVQSTKTVQSTQTMQASTQILQEASLHRVKFNPPKYPPDALMRQLTGAVELDFTVTPAGTVADIQVTKSDPVGVFEQASIAALSRNRYEPVQRDGVPVAQRAHIRLRFAL